MEEYLYSLLSDVLPCPVSLGYFSDGMRPPLVTVLRVSGRREHTLTSLGLMRGSVQVDCWAETYIEALNISNLVRSALEQHSGGPVVLSRLTSERSGVSGDVSVVQRHSLTFALTYQD
ncbi:tail completion protein gp17 [Epibacterium ulvae]|uniref:tail completion protein gp17 n=1 Tax=Epibacterium ulvae TaxID=1156985 RepID=UPI00248F712D|nr:DUF3168 domain-containing protein [Epibacterium ulvae]